MIDTSETLLDRLKAEAAHEAWKEFYEQYWGVIVRYAQKLGLNVHQAEEVLQETMVTLMQVLPKFCYDRRRGRFRNFLLTIVHRKVSAARRRLRSSASDVPWDESLAFDDGSRGSAGAEALARWREAICEEALRRLGDDPNVAETTLRIFRAYVIDQRAAAEVAQEFSVTENGVYQIKNRLLRRIRQDVTTLMRNAGADSP